MFNKELKAKVDILEKANAKQDEINKQIITVLESQNKIIQELATRIEVLERGKKK